MSLRSKCDRAITAYLQSMGVAGDIYPANSSAEREVPCVTVLSHSGRAEVPITGIYRFQVRIRIQGHAGQQPDETNPEAQRVSLDELVVGVSDAMMQSGDGDDLQATAAAITASGRALATDPDAQRAANNADMVDFTCQSLYDTGLDGGNPSTGGGVDGNYWVEDLLFEAVCCATNTD